MKLSKDFLKI